MRGDVIEVSDVLTLNPQTQRIFVTRDFYLVSIDQAGGLAVFLQSVWEEALEILAVRDPRITESFDPGVDGFPNLLVSMESELNAEFAPTGRTLYTFSNDVPVPSP